MAVLLNLVPGLGLGYLVARRYGKFGITLVVSLALAWFLWKLVPHEICGVFECYPRPFWDQLRNWAVATAVVVFLLVNLPTTIHAAVFVSKTPTTSAEPDPELPIVDSPVPKAEDPPESAARSANAEALGCVGIAVILLAALFILMVVAFVGFAGTVDWFVAVPIVLGGLLGLAGLLILRQAGQSD